MLLSLALDSASHMRSRTSLPTRAVGTVQVAGRARVWMAIPPRMFSTGLRRSSLSRTARLLERPGVTHRGRSSPS